MTRSILATLGLLALGCPLEDSAPIPPLRGRVEAVAVDHKAALASFCEVLHPAGDGPTFSLPPLDMPAPALGKGWTWVSLWATWCRPCIEELPLLRSWQADFTAPATPLDVLFLSVDADAAALAQARTARSDLPGGPRVLDPDGVEAWLASLGLTAPASIPIHVLVDPGGKVRCIRVGAVSAPDRAAVAALLASG
jgi:thiol-disulfide isomerase/thioredoxin